VWPDIPEKHNGADSKINAIAEFIKRMHYMGFLDPTQPCGFGVDLDWKPPDDWPPPWLHVAPYQAHALPAT
jgi:hypothetical protein